jgi:hypothetical protein
MTTQELYGLLNSVAPGGFRLDILCIYIRVRAENTGNPYFKVTEIPIKIQGMDVILNRTYPNVMTISLATAIQDKCYNIYQPGHTYNVCGKCQFDSFTKSILAEANQF